MLSCTTLTKKVCKDQTHCDWIVKKGCRNNSKLAKLETKEQPRKKTKQIKTK